MEENLPRRREGTEEEFEVVSSSSALASFITLKNSPNPLRAFCDNPRSLFFSLCSLFSVLCSHPASIKSTLSAIAASTILSTVTAPTPLAGLFTTLRNATSSWGFTRNARSASASFISSLS
jgi:hypothetical protein